MAGEMSTEGRAILTKLQGSRRNFRQTLSIVIDNSAGNAAVDVSIFDATGACGGNTTNDSMITVNYAGGIAGLRKKLLGCVLLVSGFNYQVTSSSTQFAKAFKVLVGGIESNIDTKDIAAAIANGRRPSNQDDKVRIIDFQTALFDEMNWLVTVATGEKITLLLDVIDSTQIL